MPDSDDIAKDLLSALKEAQQIQKEIDVLHRDRLSIDKEILRLARRLNASSN